MPNNIRVCVVGAGAAGLSAAHFLKKRGFTDVTVLEKSSRLGGKCWTIEHGGRTYELGAGIHTVAYRTISEIMADVGVESTHVRSTMYLDTDSGAVTDAPFYLRPKTWLAVLASAPFLARVLYQHRKMFGPGFAGLDRELCEPFDVWARKRHLSVIAETMTPFNTGFGYGYSDEVPAAYGLKYITVLCPPREYLEGGYQGLWQQVAEELDVRLETEIESIERGDRVRVVTQRGSLEFDRLVVASPLDDALDFLDASAEETELFSRIRYYDYHVYAGLAEGLPQQRYGLIPTPRRERTMFWYRRWTDSDLVTFYSVGRASRGMREPADHERIRANIEEDLHAFGGRVRDYVTDVVWKYFPHVTGDEIADGYYDRLESLQGQRHTYYTGELLNFSTVETVARYSKHIAEQLS